jgi:hypothetical protein
MIVKVIYLLSRCWLIVLFFPGVEEMSGHILDVNCDVHSNNGFLVIGTRNVVVGEDSFASSKKVLKLKDPVGGKIFFFSKTFYTV